jgi:hypothetical protein
MQFYVVAKNFIVGEIDKSLKTSQVVGFDGTTLMLGDKKFVAPGLTGAIRRGWLLPTEGDAVIEAQSNVDPRFNSQALLDRYKVSSHESSDSPLPRKQPRALIDFGTKVISDADEDNVPLEDALPSVKMKRAARKALKGNNAEVIPTLEVKSDGGNPTSVKRQPREVKKNILSSLPLVDTKVSVPTVEPKDYKKVFGGVEFDQEAASSLKSDTFEALAVPTVEPTTTPELPPVQNENGLPGVELLGVTEPIPPKTSRRKAPKKTEEDHVVLAASIGAEPLAKPMADGVPDNWKNWSFRERRDFVDQTNDIGTLKSLLLVERGAVKKFITSKLETLPNA